MRFRRYDTAGGFALLGALAVLILVAAAVGGGAYVMYRHNHKPIVTTYGTSSSMQTTASNAATQPATPGTTVGISQLTQADAQNETSVNTGADSQLQQDAASANTAQTNVGGTYDETSF